jgi:hypothetical protein
VALTLSSHGFSKSDFGLTLSDLLKKYPDNRVIRELKQGADQQAAQLAQQQGQETDRVGKLRPINGPCVCGGVLYVIYAYNLKLCACLILSQLSRNIET